MSTDFSPYLRLIQRTGATKHPYGFFATDLLLSRIPLDRKKHVLDVGCGAGHTSAYVAKNYDCFVTGIDISEMAIDRAKALHGRESYRERLTFLVGDTADLPFADDKFDVVICESVLFFINDKKTALNEISRVLKTAGYLALNEVIVAEGEDKQRIKDYFLRPEFGGFLVTADDLRRDLNSEKWSIIFQDEKPIDLISQLKSELTSLFSFKTLLPLFEMAHLAWSSKDVREDLVSVVKFLIDMPKGGIGNLNSYLLLAQKKPLSERP